MNWLTTDSLKDILAAIKYFLSVLFARPEEAKDHPINQEPVTAPPTVPVPTPAEQLCATAVKYLGKDASPDNLAKSELACAESVTHIINETWPGTLDPRIVGTDALFFALQRSKRFKGTLDPVPGTIEVSPRTATVFGHTGVYVGADQIASNDSSDGKFRINYTRASWRREFIQRRGLKACLFTPTDLTG